jgi:hypothetical protein
MADRETQLGRNVLQRESSAEIGLEPFASPLRLPWRKAAGRGFGVPQSAICPSDVCRERKHHVIDEKLVRFERAAQSGQERCADVMHDGVAKAGAILIVQLIDTPHGELLCHAVESRRRNIEIEGVKRPVDHVAWFTLHIVDICLACADIGFGNALAVLPVFAVAEIAQFSS